MKIINNAPQGRGKAIAAMVLGIVAIIIAWFPFVSIASIILSIIGLVACTICAGAVGSMLG